MIINADDLGMAPGVNQGILETMTNGVVSSTTLMANMPWAQGGATLALKYQLPVGIHLNLTTGKPISDPKTIPSLVRPDGMFYANNEFISRLLKWKISRRDIEKEFSAQVEAVLGMGIQPTHFDTHHHTHLWFPVAMVMTKVARRYGITKTRTTCTTDMGITIEDRQGNVKEWAKRRYKSFIGKMLTKYLQVATWRMEPSAFRKTWKNESLSALEEWLLFLGQLKSLPQNVTVEVPCHPAYLDKELQGNANYVKNREKEVQALTSPELKTALTQAGIKLISFRDL